MSDVEIVKVLVPTEPRVVKVEVPGPPGPPGPQGPAGEGGSGGEAATPAELEAEATARKAADSAEAKAREEADASEQTAREAGDEAVEEAASSAQSTADAALPKAGGTLTGPLTLSGDPVAGLQAATRQYVLARIAALVDGAPEALDTLKEIASALEALEGSDLAALEALAEVVAGKLAQAQNLADLSDVTVARSNLGLGSAAIADSGDFDAAGAAEAVGTEASTASVKVAVYGEDATTARPDADCVIWIGAEEVEPENAEKGDLRVVS